MRCFKDHEVVEFNSNRNSMEPLHQPVLCGVHPNERVRSFCTECKVSFSTSTDALHRFFGPPGYYLSFACFSP